MLFPAASLAYAVLYIALLIMRFMITPNMFKDDSTEPESAGTVNKNTDYHRNKQHPSSLPADMCRPMNSGCCFDCFLLNADRGFPEARFSLLLPLTAFRMGFLRKLFRVCFAAKSPFQRFPVKQYGLKKVFADSRMCFIMHDSSEMLRTHFQLL